MSHRHTEWLLLAEIGCCDLQDTLSDFGTELIDMYLIICLELLKARPGAS